VKSVCLSWNFSENFFRIIFIHRNRFKEKKMTSSEQGSFIAYSHSVITCDNHVKCVWNKLQQPTWSKRHRLRYRSRSLQDSKRHFLQVFSVHRKIVSIYSVRFLWNITALFIFSLNTKKKNSILVFLCERIGVSERLCGLYLPRFNENYLISLSHSLHAYLIRFLLRK
jgi:hypothetical protein